MANPKPTYGIGTAVTSTKRTPTPVQPGHGKVDEVGGHDMHKKLSTGSRY